MRCVFQSASWASCNICLIQTIEWSRSAEIFWAKCIVYCHVRYTAPSVLQLSCHQVFMLGSFQLELSEPHRLHILSVRKLFLWGFHCSQAKEVENLCSRCCSSFTSSCISVKLVEAGWIFGNKTSSFMAQHRLKSVIYLTLASASVTAGRQDKALRAVSMSCYCCQFLVFFLSQLQPTDCWVCALFHNITTRCFIFTDEELRVILTLIFFLFTCCVVVEELKAADDSAVSQSNIYSCFFVFF